MTGQKAVPEWRHNLYILWIGNFIVAMGFQLFMPFFPLYIRTLGSFNRFQLNMWSGVVFCAAYCVSSWMAPIWGKFADQHGRKKVLLLSSAGMATMVTLMGLVTNVYELALCRLLQGFFSGYISNTSALIAASVPGERSGQALSLLSTGTTAGMLIGPFFGGVIANAFGYRLTFILTGLSLYFVCGFTLLFVWEKHFTPLSAREMLSTRELFHSLKHPRIIMGMIVTTLIIQAANNSISPVISLYIRQLMHGQGRVALVSGIIAALPGISTLLVAKTFGAWGDRIGTHKILLAGFIFAFIVFIPQAFVHNVWELGILRFLVGISDAALLPQVQTMLAKYSNSRYSGRIFSYNQSAQFAGNIVGSLLGSTVSGLCGYGAVFLSTAGLVAVNFFWVRRSVREILHQTSQNA